jgi:NAD(P)-dependent dehydrogenase (short-subunit alcohol dehydrogenase family)
MDETQAKIALVTGANRGIGYEVCRQLARLEMQVILTSREVVKGEQAVEALRREGGQVVCFPLDVTEQKQVEHLRLWVAEHYGRLDVLVNNAGVYFGQDKSVLNAPLDVVRQTMEVNYYGPLYLCRAFVPMMKKAGYGRVVNVSSEMGSLAGMGGNSAGYRASKAALNALTRIVASEVRGYNLKVNSACPGWVRSDMGGDHAPRSLEQGAKTIVWLATLPDDGPSGGFYKDHKVVPW